MTTTADGTERENQTAQDRTSPAIETHGLTKRYGAHIMAVQGLNMTVRRGEVYGFLGPNGSGKTTTIRMLLGLARPTAGMATVLEAAAGSSRSLARVGALVETPAFYPYLSGRDNLRALARYTGIGDHRVEQVLEIVALAKRGRDKFQGYSLGMKQRLGIAAALLKDPELLILDEPTNGLDPQGVVDVRNLVRSLASRGKTLLISSHLLSEVEQVADRVGIIQRGRLLAEGAVEDLRRGGGITVAAEPLDQARRVLATLYPADAITTVDGLLKISGDPDGVPAVADALVHAGVRVRELRRTEQTLEQVFLQLTSESKEV